MNAILKYLDFIFYKSYSFYKKYWSQFEPETYALLVVSLSVILILESFLFWFLFLIGAISEMPGNLEIIGMALIVIYLFFRRYFYIDNHTFKRKYHNYIKKELYTEKFYQGYKGSLLVIFSVVASIGFLAFTALYLRQFT